MEKKKYFVNIGTLEISQMEYGNNKDFTIYATGEEVYHLREIMNEMYDSDMRGFWRAHVPYVPYHNDKSNDTYDDGIVEAFQMIHDLGDETTKEHIETMGVLDNK
ncbi:hydrolase [Aquibacillus koreensis]|uniref:Hydrolase n=1 Tax=Aquibacillus koreensis TaxID=279446 RepID=A0A9X3WN11_9BACI|nr:hydrolase [Aquibacillus koreensis]MCT2535843.1 hydrolase [Aquibacillus koreensis]MDC3420299.1 hydrolase [Aquibacillus koreensis]